MIKRLIASVQHKREHCILQQPVLPTSLSSSGVKLAILWNPLYTYILLHHGLYLRVSLQPNKKMLAYKSLTVLAAATIAHAQLPLPPMPPLTNTTTVPVHFGFVVFPSLTPLDMFGPMEILIGLSIYYGNVTGKMHMSILGAENTPSTCAPPNSQFGMGLSPTVTFDEYRELARNDFTIGKHAEKGPLDVLIVPGGGG
jgi:hypothetical protein